MEEVKTLLMLIKRIVSSKCGSVAIATRHSGLNVLYTYLDKIHHHYSMEGFSEEEVEQFFNSLPNSNRIHQILEDNRVLKDMCNVPAFCEELKLSYLTMASKISKSSLTDIVGSMILSLVKHEVKGSVKQGINSFNSLPTEYKEGFKTVCKLAFEKTFLAEKIDNIESSTFFLSSFFLYPVLAI